MNIPISEKIITNTFKAIRMIIVKSLVTHKLKFYFWNFDEVAYW